ncbi:TolC family protein [Spirosoma taeanense]|uniref:TolC family protein n=1 Tax=Spirosoma taeanense TaxID=2735870 RepID=A0A6M5Y6R1_9BACT|nr:TolC family protein [Spirosoma taeanense]QJW89040.1 TolC family protein [Spirosoma taeanense]
MHHLLRSSFFSTLLSWLFVIGLVAASATSSSAQMPVSNQALPISAVSDTLRITLPQADELFKNRNLTLLAAQSGIRENQAYELQAQLRINPTLYIETMPYNAQTHETLPFKQTNSEQVVQVQQLIRLAGKRNKQLAIARTGTELATDRFYDLIRTLTYQLHTTFYNLFYDRQSLGIYNEEITTLQQTVNLYQQQFDKGNVPLKDLSRLKAYLFNLTTERQQILHRITDDQGDLTVLLNASPTVTIQPLLPSGAPDQFVVSSLALSNLYQLAEQHRFDLKTYRDVVKQEQQNVTLQKALAVPDLTVQGTYDRNAGYIPNYIGVGIGISLPVLNKNQGNIQAATIRTQSSQQALSAYTLQVDSDVQRAYVKAQQTEQLYRAFDQRFNNDFGRLIQGVTMNYKKQNIDVVEFLDFFDSYKNSQIQFAQLQNDRMQSLEEIVFAVGTNPFRI